MKVENTAFGSASISPRATDAHCHQKRLIRLVTFWWIRRLKKKNTHIYINLASLTQNHKRRYKVARFQLLQKSGIRFLAVRKTIIIMKCQPTAEMEVHKMNILVGIWPCQLLEQMKHPQLSWNILVAYHSCCSIKMSDSTAISAK